MMNPRKRLSPCGVSLVRLALGPQPNGTREGQPAKFTLYSLTLYSLSLYSLTKIHQNSTEFTRISRNH